MTDIDKKLQKRWGRKFKDNRDWHTKRVPYRMIEGMTQDLVRMGSMPEYNDYSTVNRRINQLDFRLAPPQGKRIMARKTGDGYRSSCSVMSNIMNLSVMKCDSCQHQNLKVLSDRLPLCSNKILISPHSAATEQWMINACGIFATSKDSFPSSNLIRTRAMTLNAHHEIKK